MKKNIKNLCILLCMVLVFTGVTACARQQEEGNTMADVPVSQTESSEKTEADNTEEVYQELTIDQQQLPEYYDFVSKTYNDILSEKENENIVYAPMNFYLSLSMLSEMTENEARKELQNALGYQDLDKHTIEVQNFVNFLKQRQQNDPDGVLGRLNLDNSFWLQDTLDYREAVMNKLQMGYGLEVFKGDFTNSEFQEKMTDWVYEKTNHALQPQFSDLINSPEDNAFSIISTLDYIGQWTDTFDTDDTQKGIFYCGDGTQTECEFMNSEDEGYEFHDYLKGEDYISTALRTNTREKMIFILPDEKQDIYDFWNGDRLTEILSAWENDECSKAKLKFSVPKFNCSSKTDLKTIAEKMKVNQVFDPSSGAFAPLSDDPLYLTDIKQEASISIYETGCSVASYIHVSAAGAEPKEYDEVKICLDRPFYYIICKEGVPFLIGFVHNPVE